MILQSQYHFVILFSIFLIIFYIMRRTDIKILLVQIRKDVETKQEEYFQFLRRGFLVPAQVHTWDAFERPRYDLGRISNYDAVMIGGTSDDKEDDPYFSSDVFPWVPSALAIVDWCYKYKIPMLASCGGFELVVQALPGGEMIIDKENLENSVIPITLTGKAMEDPVFEGVPKDFFGVSYHIKRASSLPDGAVNYAYSEKCPFHAFKMEDAPLYAFQFHPEMSKYDLYSRLVRYKDKYQVTDEELERVEEEYEDTHLANKIIENFITSAICRGHCQ